jgi:hypothetical protein
MPTLRELQEQRETLVAAARERLDQINANTDESRAAELETQHDAAWPSSTSSTPRSRAKSASPRRAVAAERRERELRDRRPVDAVDDTDAGDAPEGRRISRRLLRLPPLPRARKPC